MAGVAYKPLTVDFHEPGVVGAVNRENQFKPWYMLSNKEQRQLGAPWGPATPQALNRYSYVLNNPMKWTDPGGHSVYMSQQEARDYVSSVKAVAQLLRDAQADANIIGIPSTIVGGLEALLKKYGVARIFVESFAKGLMRVFALAALFGFVGGWALGVLAERLESYAKILTDLIDDSPSGIIVANGCAFEQGQAHAVNGCGVTVVSRDTGNGYTFDYGPAGLLIGWGGIWAPGTAYLPDGSLYTGKDRLVHDR